MTKSLYALTALLLCGGTLPAAAQEGSLQLWEDSLGAPGVTAEFDPGIGWLADIDLDADSAEGGGLWGGPSEIVFEPTGSVVFVDFSCEFQAPCVEDVDYVFTPGGEGEGAVIVVSDTSFQEQHGIRDVGTIEFDAVDAPGTIELEDCFYTGLDFMEYRCAPFTLVSLPEPGRATALAAGLALLTGLRGVRERHRSCH